MTTFGFDQEGDTPEETEKDLPELMPDDFRDYSPQEKALRDLFVTEYLVDYDGWKAAMRCGFNKQFAIEYSKKFLGEPYVQQRISQIRTLAPRNEEALGKYNKRRVEEQLLVEAHNHGPGSSQAARVAALKTLSDIYGMGSAAQARIALANGAGVIAGGVMVVPVIANVDDWESTAMSNQKALQDDIVEDTK